MPEGYYTFETAVKAIPGSERKMGMIITYQTGYNSWETKQFIGEVLGFWETKDRWKDVVTTAELEATIKKNNSLLNSDILSLLANKANGDLGKNLFNPKT